MSVPLLWKVRWRDGTARSRRPTCAASARAGTPRRRRKSAASAVPAAWGRRHIWRTTESTLHCGGGAGGTCPICAGNFCASMTCWPKIRGRQQREGGPEIVILRGNGKGPVLTGVRISEGGGAAAGGGDRRRRASRSKTWSGDWWTSRTFLNSDEAHEVFLCWHLGEDTIDFWHEIADGYAGRRPL